MKRCLLVIGSVFLVYGLILLHLLALIPERRWLVASVSAEEEKWLGEVWFDKDVEQAIELVDGYDLARLDPANSIKKHYLPPLAWGSVIIGMGLIITGLLKPYLIIGDF